MPSILTNIVQLKIQNKYKRLISFVVFLPQRNIDMRYVLFHSNKYNHIKYECIVLRIKL